MRCMTAHTWLLDRCALSHPLSTLAGRRGLHPWCQRGVWPAAGAAVRAPAGHVAAGAGQHAAHPAHVPPHARPARRTSQADPGPRESRQRHVCVKWEGWDGWQLAQRWARQACEHATTPPGVGLLQGCATVTKKRCYQITVPRRCRLPCDLSTSVFCHIALCAGVAAALSNLALPVAKWQPGVARYW